MRFTIISKRRVDHRTGVVVHHLLLESTADPVDDATNNLTANLVRVHDNTRIDSFDIAGYHDCGHLPKNAVVCSAVRIGDRFASISRAF